MNYEKIKTEIGTELQNKKANDKLLEKIAKQLKLTEQAEAKFLKEKEKLEKLIEEKKNLGKEDAQNDKAEKAE